MKWHKPKMNWTPKKNHSGGEETIYDVLAREHKFSEYIKHIKPVEVFHKEKDSKASKKEKNGKE